MSGQAIANPFDNAPVATPDPSTGGAAIGNPFDAPTQTQAQGPTMGPQGTPPTTYQAAPDDNLAARQAQHPILTAIGQGAGDALGDLWSAVKGAPAGIVNSLPGVDLYHSVESALPIIRSYEAARSNGSGIVDSLKAADGAARQHDAAQQALKSRIADFQKQPGRATVRALGDAAALASTIWDGGTVNPANIEGPELAAAPEAVTAAPKPGLVSKAVSSVKALATDIPAETESQLVKVVGDTAEDEGLVRPESSTLKESVADLGDQFKQRAQAVYQQLDDEAPGFQQLKDSVQSLKAAYKNQLNLDPVKAEEISGQLKTAQQSMTDLLDEGQQARWKAADSDWSRYKAIQQFGIKTAKSAGDLTSPALTDVEKLHSGTNQLANATKSGNPIDLLSRAFGDHAGDIRAAVQKGANLTSQSQAAKQFLKWIGVPSGVGIAVEGANVVKKALSGKSH